MKNLLFKYPQGVIEILQSFKVDFEVTKEPNREYYYRCRVVTSRELTEQEKEILKRNYAWHCGPSEIIFEVKKEF